MFMMVVLISTRLDVLSVVYAIWLWVIFASSREGKRRIWPMFQWFIVVMIIIQYVFAVNVPPFLCFGKKQSKLMRRIAEKISILPTSRLTSQKISGRPTSRSACKR